jgi:hypothetical protein
MKANGKCATEARNALFGAKIKKKHGFDKTLKAIFHCKCVCFFLCLLRKPRLNKVSSLHSTCSCEMLIAFKRDMVTSDISSSGLPILTKFHSKKDVELVWNNCQINKNSNVAGRPKVAKITEP